MNSLQVACRTASTLQLPVNGLTLHALQWGTPGAPALLFLHGGSAHAHWFDAVAGRFADRFHVIALDQRGHGRSGWASPPAYATEDFAADLLGVMDALGWRTMSVVGHSMGGHNAMAFAAWHPERVARLVIGDSRPAIPPERLGVMHRRGQRGLRRHASRDAAVDSFRLVPRDTVAAPGLLAHLADEAVVERDGGWVMRFDPAANGSRKPNDAWLLLPRITAPTLIVRAEHSPILTPDMAEKLCDGIANARLVVVPNAHHHVVLDQPDAFAAALAAFLEESSA